MTLKLFKGMRIVAATHNPGKVPEIAALLGKTGPANETALIRISLNDGTGKFSAGADLGGQLPSEDFEDKPGSWAPTDKDVLGVVNANGWSQGLFEQQFSIWPRCSIRTSFPPRKSMTDDAQLRR